MLHLSCYYFLKPFKSWKNKYLKSISKKEAKKLGLFNLTVDEISRYTKESADVVRQKHKMGPENEKKYSIFKQAVAKREEVEEFYKYCNYYIYELPLWNAENNRPKYLAMITMPYVLRMKYKRVMDFGGGAGDLSIELSKNNLDVTYCDIGEQLYDFAGWRFKSRGLSINMAKGIDAAGDEQFDCIFSFDAFEHIKDLPETLKKLTSLLIPGGSLIFSGAFSGGTLHLEENERYNDFKNLDALMRGFGLSFQDKFAQFYFYKRSL